jgi:AraC-like DNA-binding protein
MKVNRMKLGCRREADVNMEIGSACAFIYFRSPAVFTSAGNERQVESGSALILTDGQKRHFRGGDGLPLRYDFVSFRMAAADRQYLVSMEIPVDEPFSVPDGFVVSELLRCMKAQSVHDNRYTGEFMEMSMKLILISLSSGLRQESGQRRDDPHSAELIKLREAIYADPMGVWNADDMADDMGISRVYFHRLYLAEFGVTCRQDVIESRLLYAAELLRDTELSVSAVAEKCGYESDSYFMRQFRQHKGCTPTEYRRRSRKESDEE